MEGTSHGKKRVLVVRREYERSRIEQAQLAAVYERLLPEAGVILTEGQPGQPQVKSLAAAPLVFPSEPLGIEPSLCATGGHFS